MGAFTAHPGSPISPAAPRIGRFLLSLLPLPPSLSLFPSLQAPCIPASPPYLPRKCNVFWGVHLWAKALPDAAPPPPHSIRGSAGPAGTRLPIPYMDKCVQAKSGIQAPDVSLQRSGHRTGDRGEGVGTVGRKEGEKAPTSSRSSPVEVSLFVCGFAPGPRASFPGISSFSEPAQSRAPQGKGWLHGPGCGTLGAGGALCGAGAGRGAGPVRGRGQWEGECPGTSSSASASASSRRHRRRCPGCLLPEVLLQILLPSPSAAARGRLGNPQPSSGASASEAARTRGAARCRGCRAAVRKWRPRPNHGVRVGGKGEESEGDPEFLGKRRPWAGRGWSLSPRAPCLGFSGRPGGGATPSRSELSRNLSCHSGKGLGT